MTIARRTFVQGAAALAASALGAPALAQSRGTTRLVVGFPPGGPADVLARSFVEPMKAALGAPVIVDNRPGAGGRIAADQMRSVPNDGSVLLVSPASIITLAPHLYKSVRYDVARDFAPLAPVARLDLGLYAGPAVPDNLRTLPEVLKWLQDNPARRSCGMTGAGSTPHIACLLLGRATRLDWQAVPYQGDAPAFLALLSGEIPISVASVAGGLEQVKAGKLRLLGTTSSERNPFVPDVPTMTQSGIDVVVEDRHAVFASSQTTPAALAQVQQALQQALASKEVGEVVQRMSLPRPAPVADFAALLKADSERWGNLVKTLNITVEG